MKADSAPLDSRYSWLRLLITLAIATVGNVGMWSIIVVMPGVQAELGLDRADASIPYAATMLGFALGNLVIGRAVDRFGVTRALIGAALLNGVAHGAAAMAGSLWTLTALQFLIGLGAAASFGPLIADVSHWFLRRRGIAVSIAASGNYLAGAVWPLALADVLAEDGWRAAYAALAALCVVAVIPLSLLLRRPPPFDAPMPAQAAAPVAPGGSGFSPRALQGLLALAGLGCCVAMSMPPVHIVAYCVDLGYGPAVGAEMLATMLMGGVASRLISGLIADRLGGVRTALLGSSLQCFALFLYLPFDGLAPLYIVSLIFGLSQGGIIPAYAVIVREYLPAREAGARVGFVIMATVIGMALGGWLSGWIYDATGSYRTAFLNGIAWNLMNMAILTFVLFRGRPARPRAALA